MATAKEITEIVTLKTQMATVIDRIDDLDKKIDRLIESNSRVLLMERDIELLKGELKAMKRQRWIQNTLSAGFGVFITLLITYAFKDLIGG